MGRKQKNPNEKCVKATFTIDPQLLERVKEVCDERGESFSGFVVKALKTRIESPGFKTLKETVATLSQIVSTM